MHASAVYPNRNWAKPEKQADDPYATEENFPAPTWLRHGALLRSGKGAENSACRNASVFDDMVAVFPPLWKAEFRARSMAQNREAIRRLPSSVSTLASGVHTVFGWSRFDL